MSLFHADRLLGCAVCAINFITSCSVSEKAALKCFNSTNTAGCFSSLIAPLPWSMLLAMETITVFASGCKHVYFCSKIRHFNMGVYGDLLSFRASLLWPLMELQFLKKKKLIFFFTFNLVFIHLCLILSEVHLTTRAASAVEIQPSKHLPYISMT